MVGEHNIEFRRQSRSLYDVDKIIVHKDYRKYWRHNGHAQR